MRGGEKRQEAWVWTAVVEEEDGGRWVDFEVGDRSETTFLDLFDRLPEAQRYVSDAYRVYEWLPRNRHVAGKGLEDNRIEGLHSVLRDKLNRLHRRTKGYSKGVTMLRDSIALVCLRLGLIQYQHTSRISAVVDLPKFRGVVVSMALVVKPREVLVPVARVEYVTIVVAVVLHTLSIGLIPLRRVRCTLRPLMDFRQSCYRPNMAMTSSRPVAVSASRSCFRSLSIISDVPYHMNLGSSALLR